MSTPRIGTELAGYRILTLIARGSISEVYLAENPRTGNKVALKILDSEYADHEEIRERLIRESRVAAWINHPNILPIYGSEYEDGILYVAMRYVEGPDLKRLVIEQSPLSFGRIYTIMNQLTSALDAAHAAGLVHRDLKAGNVLVVPKRAFGAADVVYLAGFGITNRVERSAGLARTEDHWGTVDYIAPEQIEGHPMDARADIYSLGCLLFECLAGTVPYAADSDAAVLWAHINEEPRLPSSIRRDIPYAVDAVVVKAMAKNPDRRYETCAEMISDLHQAMERMLDASLELQPVTAEMRAEAPTEPTNVAPADRVKPPAPVESLVWVETPAPVKPPAPVEPLVWVETPAPVETPAGASVESLLMDIAIASATVAPTGRLTAKERAPREPRMRGTGHSRKRLMAGAVLAVFLLLGGALVYAAVRNRSTSAAPTLASQPSPTSSPTASPTASPTPGPTPVSKPKPPTSLNGAPTTSTITLHWRKPVGFTPTQYLIVRGGRSWHTHKTSFTESGLPPASTFTYTLYALGTQGKKSPPVTKTISTLTPSQSAGLLSGSFFAHVAAPHPYDDTWRFAASCAIGPCNASWTAATYPGIGATLYFNGSSYQGTSNFAPFFVICQNAHAVVRVTIQITQIGSRLEGGTWKVVAFSGSITVVQPQTINCSTTAQFTYSFTAGA